MSRPAWRAALALGAPLLVHGGGACGAFGDAAATPATTCPSDYGSERGGVCAPYGARPPRGDAGA